QLPSKLKPVIKFDFKAIHVVSSKLLSFSYLPNAYACKMSVDGAFANVNQPQQQPQQQQQLASGPGNNRTIPRVTQPHFSQQSHQQQQQIHIARHSVSSPSPPPLQHHQHQHQQQYQRKPQHLSNQYFPAGSTVELTKRETGELIRGAEVLLHDPIGDCIVVRLAARSGRPGLFDVHYYNLAFVDVRIHTMPDSAGTVSPELDVEKVQHRLQRNIERANMRQQQQQAKGATGGGGAPATTTAQSASRPTA
ncbi:hypothetical protein BOX15_Mlig029473g1, partial [Macrostomum lignano]